MTLFFDCLNCNLNQAITILKQSSFSRNQQEEVIRELLTYLSTADFELSNPALMEGSYAIITKHMGEIDPYQESKEYYNQALLSIYHQLDEKIINAKDSFYMALSMAIIGNLIDFNARHSFSLELLKERLIKDSLNLEIDHSQQLYNDLKKANSLLYLGDNCGEIILDKLLIKQITREFSNLKIYYGVRGKPIVNDVTRNDASFVAMNEVAEVIDNGNGALGTVLSLCNQSFKTVFYNADVVIAKGQGNFEGLYQEDKQSIYFCFMVKCHLMAEIVGANEGSIVCLRNKY